MDHSLQEFFNIFKTTFAKFEDCQAQQLVADYLKNFSLENFQFFPMWLREQGYSIDITELAHFESLLATVERSDEKPLQKDFVQMHPSCQFLAITKSGVSLGKEPGLYAIWKSQQVNIRKLEFQEAKIIDRITEDVCFSEAELESEEARQSFLNLLSEGVLVRDPRGS